MKQKKIFLSLAGALLAFSMQAAYGGIYGGIGGVNAGVMYNDMTSLNSMLTANGYQALSSYSYIIGGGGGAYIDNVYLGGCGYGNPGQQEDNGKNVLEETGGMGFFDLGYAVVHTKYFLLTPIIGIGGSGGMISLSPSVLSNNNFSGILSNPANYTELGWGSAAFKAELSSMFRLGVANLELNLAYVYNASPQWSSFGGMNTTALVNVPQINPSTVYLTMGIYFGYLADSYSELKKVQIKSMQKNFEQMTNNFLDNIFDKDEGPETNTMAPQGASNQAIPAGLRDQAKGVLTNTGN